MDVLLSKCTCMLSSYLEHCSVISTKINIPFDWHRKRNSNILEVAMAGEQIPTFINARFPIFGHVQLSHVCCDRFGVSKYSQFIKRQQIQDSKKTYSNICKLPSAIMVLPYPITTCNKLRSSTVL